MNLAEKLLSATTTANSFQYHSFNQGFVIQISGIRDS
jgi:hypothetical protein